jgi:hypothetical protein
MRRILTGSVLLVMALAVSGCGKKDAPAKAMPAVAPKAVLQKVYDAAVAGDDATVLAHLDKATATAASELQALLKQMGKKGPSPAMMFGINGATIGEETIQGDTATVMFILPKSFPNAKPRPVQLVVEDGEWKVSLPEFVQQMKAKKAAGK